MFACIGFYFRFLVLWLLYYNCSYPVFPLVFHSTCLLLLSYHTMSLPCLISFAVYLLAPASYAHDTVFNACLWFRFIDTRVLIYARHLAFALPLTRVFYLTPLDPHVQVLELGAYGFSQLLIRAEAWISSRPSKVPSFQAPCSALEFSCYDSEPLFVLFILVHLLVFSHLRLSVM